jgi:uncharacterized membrane protein
MARTRHLIHSFEAKELKKRSKLIVVVDSITNLFGSFPFLAFNILFFASWIAINMNLVPAIPPFDPYPFVLLITTVSLEAIILSIIVLMSQNRAGIINSLREELHLQINLIAEQEITKTLQVVKLIAEKQGIKLEDAEIEEMIKTTDTTYLERRLADELNPMSQSPLQAVTQPLKRVTEDISKNLKN